MSAFEDFVEYDGMSLAELVHNGDVSPQQLVEASINRIEEHNPKLNAVIHKLYDDARQNARGDLPDGPFKGVPMLIKDLVISYKGVPTGSGTRFLQDKPATFDSEICKRFKASGAIIVGKTNTPEFGIQVFTEPEAQGPTHNPWNLEHSPGGSSGGSGAAVAARMVPFAGGGDGGGSIRIPAANNGIFGLKPTRGRTPTGPKYVELWNGFAVEHILSRSVRDSAAMLDCISGPDIGSPYYLPEPMQPYVQDATIDPGKLRIAFTTKPFQGKHVHPDCEKALNETVKLLQGLGHYLIEASPTVNREELNIAFIRYISGQTYNVIKRSEEFVGRKASIHDFELATWAFSIYGNTLSAGEYARALETLQQVSRPVGHFFQEYDVLLTPVLATPPAKTGAAQVPPEQLAMVKLLVRLRAGWLMKLLNLDRQIAEEAFEYSPYTALFNFTGQPAMSVPLQWNDAGLPIGMHFVGRFGDESTLFRLAGQLERAQPWFNKTPPGF